MYHFINYPYMNFLQESSTKNNGTSTTLSGSKQTFEDGGEMSSDRFQTRLRELEDILCSMFIFFFLKLQIIFQQWKDTVRFVDMHQCLFICQECCLPTWLEVTVNNELINKNYVLFTWFVISGIHTLSTLLP